MRYFQQKKNSTSYLALICVMIFISGCSYFSKKDDSKDSVNFSSQETAAKEFERGNVLMDSEDYRAALSVYERILVVHPVSTLDAMIMFNVGLSNLLLGQCTEAEPHFRKVVRFTHKDTPSLTVRAKLRLSEALSCQGKEKEAMVLLLEINRDKSKLPHEVAEAELPAKIAAAYSRNGNRKMADRFFGIAENGLRKVQSRNLPVKDKQALLAKTLFLMGDATNVKKETGGPEGYFQTLKVQQRYLLRAVEFDVKPWSQKAYDQLINVYGNTWDFLKDIQPDPNLDETASRRDVKVRKANVVQIAMDGLKALKDSRNLGIEPPELLNELLRKLTQQEAKLTNYLVAEVPGSEYTSEAMKLQSGKREGQVKSDETILEKKAKAKKKNK